ncbi:MAG: ATP-binding protein, partial [Clostridia bacterium]|nr:ATP-binding protein [Clostridia bacterium]
PDEFFTVVSDFYREYGAGIFGVNRAFRISDREDILEFEPVKSMDDVVLEDLVGYEVQKQRLLENTKAFVDGKPANNVLLYGDRGTGKSTSIKAVANRFWPDGLRVIQVYRHQMKMLSRIISAIRTRNYRFIIYMDDLSFEDFETEYKYLKAVIEGGLESKAENILIYATSNRRHLIKETWDDRNDMEHTGELHRGDSMEEKLSLADRFGVQIYYGKPSKDEFYRIIDELSETEGVAMDKEQLHKEANAWQIRHGDVSGRCARQFVDYIKGKA